MEAHLHGLPALAGAPLRSPVRLPRGQRALGIETTAFLRMCQGEPKLALLLARHLARKLLQRRLPYHWAQQPRGSQAPVDRPLLPAEKALALLDAQLFQGQSSQALLRIAESFVTRFYAPGQPLAEAGQPPRLIVVLAGQGEVLGEAECLTGRPWSVPLYAAEATITLEADHDAFQRLLYMLPALPFQLARHEAQRLLHGCRWSRWTTESK